MSSANRLQLCSALVASVDIQAYRPKHVQHVLTLQTAQDSNKLLASILEQQTIITKQQREATANSINADIARRANLAGNMAQVNSTLTDSLQNFRMP